MTKTEAKKIVDDFYSNHRSFNKNGHKIIVIDNLEDYSKELRGQKIKGFHRPTSNDTYIIASEHKNKEDLLKTIKHEAYGHYGLNTFSQENKIVVLLSVVHLQDTTLKDEWQQVRYDYPDINEFRQAEEVFCSVVSELTSEPEFKHSFSETLESKKDIQDIGIYIKMTLQTGDAKQLIIPENNNLQFNKYANKEVEILKRDMRDLNTHALKCARKIEELKSINQSDSILPYAEKSFLAITSAIRDTGNEMENMYNKYIKLKEEKKDNVFKETQQEFFKTSKKEYLSIQKKGGNNEHKYRHR